MTGIIGKSVRMACVTLIWTGFFIFFFLLFRTFFWVRVWHWIESSAAIANDNPRLMMDSGHWPMWVSYWLAIATWWVLSLAFWAYNSGRGGHSLYRTVTSWVSTGESISTRVVTGQTPVDENAGRAFYYTAFLYGPVMLVLSVLAYAIGPLIAFDLDARDKAVAAVLVLNVGLALPICMISFGIVHSILAPSTSLFRLILKILGYVLGANAVVWVVIFFMFMTGTIADPPAIAQPKSTGPATTVGYFKAMPDQALCDAQGKRL